ncbi:hypothetical protein [Edaphobacter aggregans]|uniref:hypothetical protein n=1 Tax=Edaphobacter aggregans TaxID=570835 RepID=UPI0012F8C5FF|nr:hypothetical protein [Edaphobacter aggregans]
MDFFNPQELSSRILGTAVKVAEKFHFAIEPDAMAYLSSVSYSPRARNRFAGNSPVVAVNTARIAFADLGARANRSKRGWNESVCADVVA